MSDIGLEGYKSKFTDARNSFKTDGEFLKNLERYFKPWDEIGRLWYLLASMTNPLFGEDVKENEKNVYVGFTFFWAALSILWNVLVVKDAPNMLYMRRYPLNTQQLNALYKKIPEQLFSDTYDALWKSITKARKSHHLAENHHYISGEVALLQNSLVVFRVNVGKITTLLTAYSELDEKSKRDFQMGIELALSYWKSITTNA